MKALQNLSFSGCLIWILWASRSSFLTFILISYSPPIFTRPNLADIGWIKISLLRSSFRSALIIRFFLFSTSSRLFFLSKVLAKAVWEPVYLSSWIEGALRYILVFRLESLSLLSVRASVRMYFWLSSLYG